MYPGILSDSVYFLLPIIMFSYPTYTSILSIASAVLFLNLIHSKSFWKRNAVKEMLYKYKLNREFSGESLRDIYDLKLFRQLFFTLHMRNKTPSYLERQEIAFSR